MWARRVRRRCPLGRIITTRTLTLSVQQSDSTRMDQSLVIGRAADGPASVGAVRAGMPDSPDGMADSA
ncbi:hypothetical protein FHX44_115854 [Pseudonocardia hierapolitana]|uniref:Uncharacterized protein n=1 Tax=Pseudonocardia hierapolitana TaxID=1128676 RepID=A0A561SYH0_9PSEU|nr:hypothetical protein FHX44_115854 [Pseudonocardia hierapolitana]